MRAVARFAGLRVFFASDPGGLRPRLYAVARFAGSNDFCFAILGARGTGFTLSTALRFDAYLMISILGLAPSWAQTQ